MQNKIRLLIIFGFCAFLLCDVKALESKDAIINDIEIPEVKSIEISWDSLYFVYDITNSYSWNENTHKYDEVSKGTWVDNGKNIKVTNKSFLPVGVNFKYTNLANSNINGVFSNDSLHLEKDESKNTKLYLNGQLNDNSNSFKKIGIVTTTVT